MSDEQVSKKVSHGELQMGKRFQGGQKKRYKYMIKASLKDVNIPPEFWRKRLYMTDQSGTASSERGQRASTKPI